MLSSTLAPPRLSALRKGAHPSVRIIHPRLFATMSGYQPESGTPQRTGPDLRRRDRALEDPARLRVGSTVPRTALDVGIDREGIAESFQPLPPDPEVGLCSGWVGVTEDALQLG